jgi:hypothetical protein
MCSFAAPSGSDSEQGDDLPQPEAPCALCVVQLECEVWLCHFSGSIMVTHDTQINCIISDHASCWEPQAATGSASASEYQNIKTAVEKEKFDFNLKLLAQTVTGSGYTSECEVATGSGYSLFAD